MAKPVEERVKEIIVEQLGVEEDDVNPNAKFIEDLGADSLDTVELVMAFEEEFDLEIPDEDAEKITTVGDAISFLKYAVASAAMAVEDAALKTDRVDATRFGVLVGSGIGGLETLLDNYEALRTKGPDRVSPFLIPMLIVNMASGAISMRLGAKGPNTAVVTACATGNHAIGDAAKIIQRGDADVMIAGGAEAIIIPLAIAGFAQMKAMSTRNDDPAHASRPFDAERDGF